MNEVENKILHDKEFSEKYYKHYYSLYLIDDDYNTYTSNLNEIKCHTKDEVELIVNCIYTNGSNFTTFVGTYLYRYFFERSQWIVKKDEDPFPV